MNFEDNFLNTISNYKIISIIGLAKNVSKTTTLNHIIKSLKGKYTLGLTSIGRDGEKYDVISHLPKPRIYVEKGTYIATAQQSINNSEIPMEIIKKTGINTPMGEVMIIRAVNNGHVELAGPSINEYLSKICSELIDLGCDIILVDGAFDRKSYATPIISDATILSTGASVSKSMQNVVDLTIHTIKLLTLENEMDKEIIEISNEILKNSKIGIINEKKSVKYLDASTALDSAKDLIENLEEDSKYIVIKGALTDKLLEDLMKSTIKYKDITILVEDGTKLFLNANVFNRYQKKGGILKVLHPIKIIAVTINPTSPLGYDFDKTEFLKLLRENLNIPVYDLGSNG